MEPPACMRAVGGCGGWVWGWAGGGSRLPASDGEGLACGGDGEGALEHARQRCEVLVRLARVDGVLVDLVRDDEQPGVAADHLGHLRHLRCAEGLARGVVRRVEHEHLGPRRDLRRARHRDMGERRAGALARRRTGAAVRRCGGAAVRRCGGGERGCGATARWCSGSAVCDGAAWPRGGVAAAWRRRGGGVAPRWLTAASSRSGSSV